MASSGNSHDSSKNNLVLFELSVGGHYPIYIQHLVRYWCEQNLPGQLSVVVSPKFLDQHQDVVSIAASREGVRFLSITPAEEEALVPRKSPIHRAIRAFQMWRLMGQYAAALKADHCLIMYLDSYQSPLAAGISSPCPVSGIYFRPTFHYPSLITYQPSWKDRVQFWRERTILPRVMRHPQLHTLFCLDPFVITHLHSFGGRAHPVYLPDPVEISAPSQIQLAQLKATLGIEPDRRIFLLFGALDGRKGIYQLLDAILMLSPEWCQKLCLLLVGRFDPQDRQTLQPKLNRIAQELGVQLIIRDEYISDTEVQTHFQLADVVLALYQLHVGMSGILVQAAAAQTPVLTTNYGLMGEMARRYELGLAVDSTLLTEIAKGLTRLLKEPLEDAGNRSKMQQFAEQNSAEHFAHTIFQSI